MATANLGVKNTGAATQYGIISANNQRAYVPDPLTSTVIFYEMGARVGAAVGGLVPSTRMGIGQTSNGEANGSPDALLTYTEAFSPATVMNSGGSGAVYLRDLIAPFIGRVGDAFSLVLTASNYALAHGMEQADDISAQNENHYNKANVSSIPTNPIGGTPSSEGNLQLWATGEINVAPAKPTPTEPVGTIISTDLTPSLAAGFSDDNETLPNGASFDYIVKYDIEVRRTSDLLSMWVTTSNAGPTQRAARESRIEYAGTALVAGTSYQWRVKHYDRAGSASVWSAWTTFSINAGGSVSTSAGTPSGKQNSDTPGPFTGVWSHPSALSTNAAIVRILDANGGVVQTMSESTPYATVVANDGTISIPWASTAFTALPRTGEALSYQIKARDSGNGWSQWSASRAFTVNATPNVPASLSPTNSQTVTSAPLLTATASDFDNLTSALTVTAEIKRADTTTITRSMTYNATTGKYQYQTVPDTDWTGYQTLQWRAKAGDGTSESAYSSYATFIYALGPSVTVTAPLDESTVTAATTRITWTVPSGGPQAKYQVLLTDATDYSGSEIQLPQEPAIYDSGLVTTTNMFYDVPTGIFRNGTRWALDVYVTNESSIVGQSQRLEFNVVYTPPTTMTSFTAQPTALYVSSGSDAVLLDWAASTYPGTQFVAYNLYETALSGDDAGVRRHLRRIPNAAQTGFLVVNRPSGIAFLYELEQVVKIGVEEISSVAAQATVSVSVPHVVLTSAMNPEAYGVEFRYKAGTGGHIQSSMKRDRRKVVPVGGSVGRTVDSPFKSWDDKGAFEFITDTHTTATEKLARFEALVENSSTMCLRDFTGLFRFVSLDNLDIVRFSVDRFQVAFTTSEEYFDEGEQT
jgi:hypothetical protein